MNSEEDYFFLGVKALIVNQEGKLLVLQKNPKKLKQVKKTCWDIPGGRMQKNESLEIALKREVYEEIGLKNFIRSIPFTIALSTIRVPIPNGDVGLIFATYLCEIESEHSISLSDEHIRFAWTSPKKAANLLAASNYPDALRTRAKISCTI